MVSKAGGYSVMSSSGKGGYSVSPTGKVSFVTYRGGSSGGGGGGSSAPSEASVSIKGTEVFINGQGYSVPIEKQASFIQQQTGGYGASAQQSIALANQQYQSYQQQQQQIQQQQQAQARQLELAKQVTMYDLMNTRRETLQWEPARTEQKETGVYYTPMNYVREVETPSWRSPLKRTRFEIEKKQAELESSPSFVGRAESSILGIGSGTLGLVYPIAHPIETATNIYQIMANPLARKEAHRQLITRFKTSPEFATTEALTLTLVPMGLKKLSNTPVGMKEVNIIQKTQRIAEDKFVTQTLFKAEQRKVGSFGVQGNLWNVNKAVGVSSTLSKVETMPNELARISSTTWGKTGTPRTIFSGVKKVKTFQSFEQSIVKPEEFKILTGEDVLGYKSIDVGRIAVSKGKYFKVKKQGIPASSIFKEKFVGVSKGIDYKDYTIFAGRSTTKQTYGLVKAGVKELKLSDVTSFKGIAKNMPEQISDNIGGILQPSKITKTPFDTLDKQTLTQINKQAGSSISRAVRFPNKPSKTIPAVSTLLADKNYMRIVSGKTLTKQKPATKQSDIYLGKFDTSLFASTSQKDRAILSGKTITSQVNRQRTNQRENQLTKEVQKERSLLTQRTGQIQQQRQNERQLLKSIYGMGRGRAMQPFVPKITTRIFLPPRQFRSERKLYQGLFGVSVRRQGKFRTVGAGMSLQQAMNIGQSKVERSLGATFRIEGYKGLGEGLRTPKGFYTKASKEGTLFIEKIGRRIKRGTPEVPEIQLAKRMKSGKGMRSIIY